MTNPENRFYETLARVADPLEIHMRPSQALAVIADECPGEVYLEHKGKRINAHNLMQIPTLAAQQGGIILIGIEITYKHHKKIAEELKGAIEDPNLTETRSRYVIERTELLPPK